MFTFYRDASGPYVKQMFDATVAHLPAYAYTICFLESQKMICMNIPLGLRIKLYLQIKRSHGSTDVQKYVYFVYYVPWYIVLLSCGPL